MMISTTKSDLCRRNGLRSSSGEITRQSDSAHIYAGPRRQPIISPNGRASLRIMRKDEAGMLASVAMSMRVAYGQMSQLHFREVCSEELS